MSVPEKNTIWGYMIYKGKEFGVLSAPLSDEIVEKINSCNAEKNLLPYTSAPWKYKKYWSIEDGRLFLTKLYSEEFHRAVFGGNEKVPADWVDKVEILAKHRLICRTYEQRGSYLNEMETLNLSFEEGRLVDEQRETELYTSSIELRNYIDRNKRYATLCIDSVDLLNYLIDDTGPEDDQVFPMVSDFISHMTLQGTKDDISLDMKDVQTVLKKGDLAVFASAKGSDIDEMVGSLVDSMTDEILKPKGCLIHFGMNRDFPIEKVEHIVNQFEEKLDLDKEAPSNFYFIFGTQMRDDMRENEVLIRVLLSI